MTKQSPIHPCGSPGEIPDDARATPSSVLRDALERWTFATLDGTAAHWLHGAMARAGERRELDLAFGLAPRRLGRARVPLDAAARDEADALLPGWRPDLWRIDEAARVLLVAAHLETDPAALARLQRHADADEQCALLKGLALYPGEAELEVAVGHGLRSDMAPVFAAVAHHNPWPAGHFDEHRWNHLVLKALFVELPLAPIAGFDARRNRALARMLLDFAAERRAAGRQVPIELWRGVTPVTDAAQLERWLPPRGPGGRWSDTRANAAMALALFDSPDACLRELARDACPRGDAMRSGRLCWHSLATTAFPRDILEARAIREEHDTREAHDTPEARDTPEAVHPRSRSAAR